MNATDSLTGRIADVAVIGAGPGGLSAAERLQELGYSSIVLERRAEPGGQACSRTYVDGDREIVYDVGSVQPLVTPVLAKLIKKHGITYGRGHSAKRSRMVAVYSFAQRRFIMDSTKPIFGYGMLGMPALARDLVVLSRELFRIKGLRRPGYGGRETIRGACLPFNDWWRSLNLTILGEGLGYMLSSVESGGTYSTLDDVPAMRAMKNLLQLIGPPTRYINGSYKPFTGGAQSLWSAIAKNHDVRYNAQIESITRKAAGVTIKVDGIEMWVDKLVVAAPLPEILDVLDGTTTERDLAASVRYCPVYRGYFVARGLPTNRLIGFPDSFYPASTTTFPVSMIVPEHNVGTDGTLYSFILPVGYAEGDYQSQAENMLADHFGAKILEWNPKLVYWRTYGPHFSVEAAQAGAYTTLENLQGFNRTLYVGGWAGGDGHGNVASYAFHTIESHFANRR